MAGRSASFGSLPAPKIDRAASFSSATLSSANREAEELELAMVPARREIAAGRTLAPFRLEMALEAARKSGVPILKVKEAEIALATIASNFEEKKRKQAELAATAAGPVEPHAADLIDEQIAEFKQVFELYSEADGEITTKELRVAILRSLGRKPTEAELQGMIIEINATVSDGVGTLDLSGFCGLVLHLVHHPRPVEAVHVSSSTDAVAGASQTSKTTETVVVGGQALAVVGAESFETGTAADPAMVVVCGDVLEGPPAQTESAPAQPRASLREQLSTAGIVSEEVAPSAGPQSAPATKDQEAAASKLQAAARKKKSREQSKRHHAKTPMPYQHLCANGCGRLNREKKWILKTTLVPPMLCCFGPLWLIEIYGYRHQSYDPHTKRLRPAPRIERDFFSQMFETTPTFEENFFDDTCRDEFVAHHGAPARSHTGRCCCGTSFCCLVNFCCSESAKAPRVDSDFNAVAQVEMKRA